MWQLWLNLFSAINISGVRVRTGGVFYERFTDQPTNMSAITIALRYSPYRRGGVFVALTAVAAVREAVHFLAAAAAAAFWRRRDVITAT